MADESPMTREQVLDLYERYLACCNEHRVDDLGQFVDDDVSGSGPQDGVAAFIEAVRAVITGFPDYRWAVQQVLVDGDTLAARLLGQGTHAGVFEGIAPTGRSVRTQELVFYRVAHGKIAGCWGDLFPVVRDALTSGSSGQP